MRLEPFASYLKRGVIWAGGSDYSVTPYPARYGLWASVARETQAATYGKTPFGSAESMRARRVISETLGAEEGAPIRKVLREVLLFTLITELAGGHHLRLTGLVERDQ